MRTYVPESEPDTGGQMTWYNGRRMCNHTHKAAGLYRYGKWRRQQRIRAMLRRILDALRREIQEGGD